MRIRKEIGVLIISEDTSFTTNAVNILGMFGIADVSSRRNLLEASALIEQKDHEYALVVLDVNNTVEYKRKFEACEHIKAMSPNTICLVVMKDYTTDDLLSAYTHRADGIIAMNTLLTSFTKWVTLALRKNKLQNIIRVGSEDYINDIQLPDLI